MILYVNGDSHSCGHDAGGPDHAYGRHIANTLNYDYICDAEPGCSNDSIIDRTRKYLETDAPDFIVIGWSTWERETWYWNNQAYNITASGVDTVHPELQDKYKQWVIDQSTPEQQLHNELTNHDKIWQFHNEIKHIPHLFFNCYSHFFYTQRQNKPKYDWGDSFIDPYNQNSTYYFWLENMGYRPANSKFYHYGADAHRAWAEFLLLHINLQINNHENKRY